MSSYHATRLNLNQNNMSEKIKSEPTTREQRRPVLEAARAGDSKKIAVALAPLTDGQIESIKDLCRAEWAEILGRNLMLLSERIDALTSTRQATHDKALASNTGTPATPPAPTARPSAPAPASTPGPSRGTRTTTHTSPQATRVAEGMR